QRFAPAAGAALATVRCLCHAAGDQLAVDAGVDLRDLGAEQVRLRTPDRRPVVVLLCLARRADPGRPGARAGPAPGRAAPGSDRNTRVRAGPGARRRSSELGGDGLGPGAVRSRYRVLQSERFGARL